MSALTQTQSTPMESNKRTADTALRSQFMKKQKNMAEKWKSVDVPNASPNGLQPETPSYDLDLPKNLADIQWDVSMIKRRNGEFTPKVHLKDDQRKKNMSFLFPKMQVKWQNLGKEGNLNKTMGKYTVTDVNKARYTASLEPGCPEELSKLLPTLEEEQKEFMGVLKHVCDSHMEHAYHHDDTSWNRTRDERELEEFVSSANYSCFKTVKDENDDTYEIVSIARRLTDFQGNPNNPVFWKVNAEGKFEVIEPKYIPKGSLIQCTGTLRAYNINKEMYGVSCDMGRDIIVVWMPPKDGKKTNTEEKKKSLPSVPFISFDY